MKTDFGTIDGVATVEDALKKMKNLKIAVLVVNKRHEDDEYGLLTSGDIAQHVLAKDRAPDRANVYEIMINLLFQSILRWIFAIVRGFSRIIT